MKAGKAGFTLHKALLQTVLEPVFIINAAGRQKTRSDGIKWL